MPDDVLNFTLVPVGTEPTSVPGYTFLPSDTVVAINSAGDNPLIPKTYTSKPKVLPMDTGEKVICFDCEATGLNPWEDRLIVVGAWDVQQPKSEIISFASLDEEMLVNAVLDWFDDEKPDALTGYNMAYDVRRLLTRAMYFQHKASFLNSVKYYDTMEILKKGTYTSIASTQPAGTVEDWETYFWDIKKPYTIQECFDDLAAGSIEKFRLRNRSCVSGEGDLFNLVQWVLQEEDTSLLSITPPIAERTKAKSLGHVEVQCPICRYAQDFNLDNVSQICIICGAVIPSPLPADQLQEYVRPLDQAAILASGSSGSPSTASNTAKATTTTTKAKKATSTTTVASTAKSTVTLTASQKKKISAIYANSESGTNVLNADEKKQVADIYAEAA